jgi:hypothetical protein
MKSMAFQPLPLDGRPYYVPYAEMVQTQTRISDYIDVFYTAADRTSDGAMAAHAYKRSVEELDAGVSRELVRVCLAHVRA